MSRRDPGPPPGGRSAGGKLLAVLDAFTRERPALTLSELARATGVPLSTAHRLVAELCAWGGLERSADGRYRVGLRVWELGALAPRGLGLREAALPFMEDLYEVTHENVQLAVRQDTEVLFIERFAARDAVPVLTQVGGRFALSATAVGLVLLAHAPAEVQERVLAAPLHRFTEHTVVDPRRLRAVLAEVRRAGCAVSDRQVTVDAVSVAAPVLARGEVVAALSVVVRGSSAAAVRSVTPGVRAAARAISRAVEQAGLTPEVLSAQPAG
ncbi:helix-turn-helix domain-containing protein [Modestobacter sp. I12A-02628]|uniref:Glycerol operon regulatory protein n=1 Tax=Goekera deserti TaxID=2497753 RepID=A0A7K3W9K5_9ACTN|nr:IclR family transcriptional regulator [Goekera deserti]MPQ98836.1 helix-turn-helix domain-containing protein [Goekera deserti]NDI49665.1 helix-turn-helix domain-containing protein [Goekera deserti]NEL53142.1 IclR family transcriptional regulator [Goekera deserti]